MSLLSATQLIRQKVASVANDYKEAGLTFAVAAEDDFADLLKQFGLDESGEDVNIAILGEKDKKYPMEPQDFEVDMFRDFLDDFVDGEYCMLSVTGRDLLNIYRAFNNLFMLNGWNVFPGKLKPRIKSQPVPKKKKGPVTVVVGNNFEKIVMDKTKDVLIEFYAPWCGHCKALEPAYKELAKKYKKNKKLVIAKLDATANDVPENYASQGYPTIYFAPTNKKDEPIKFNGDSRTAEGLDKFIQAHATVPLDAGSKKDEL